MTARRRMAGDRQSADRWTLRTASISFEHRHEVNDARDVKLMAV